MTPIITTVVTTLLKIPEKLLLSLNHAILIDKKLYLPLFCALQTWWMFKLRHYVVVRCMHHVKYEIILFLISETRGMVVKWWEHQNKMTEDISSPDPKHLAWNKLTLPLDLGAQLNLNSCPGNLKLPMKQIYEVYRTPKFEMIRVKKGDFRSLQSCVILPLKMVKGMGLR